MADLGMTEDEAIAVLDGLTGQDPEHDHGTADGVLMEMVSPAVREAYDRLVERADWWANA